MEAQSIPGYTFGTPEVARSESGVVATGGGFIRLELDGCRRR